MLKLNVRYSGATVLGHVQDMGNKISIDGTFVRVPLEKIDKHGVYSFIKNNKGGIVIQHHNDSWSCDTVTFNQIQADGKRILDNMFGDILNQTKNIK